MLKSIFGKSFIFYVAVVLFSFFDRFFIIFDLDISGFDIVITAVVSLFKT